MKCPKCGGEMLHPEDTQLVLELKKTGEIQATVSQIGRQTVIRVPALIRDYYGLDQRKQGDHETQGRARADGRRGRIRQGVDAQCASWSLFSVSVARCETRPLATKLFSRTMEACSTFFRRTGHWNARIGYVRGRVFALYTVVMRCSLHGTHATHTRVCVPMLEIGEIGN